MSKYKSEQNGLTDNAAIALKKALWPYLENTKVCHIREALEAVAPMLLGTHAPKETVPKKLLTTCPYCNGKGETPSGGGSTRVEWTKCRRCDGKGKI